MKCLFCGCEESKVLDSRSVDETNAIRRRRECLGCGKRFTTYEMVETAPILVVKKNGDRQAFRVDKIKSGIIKACEKRPVSINQIDEVVERIEKRVQNSLEREIQSTKIGEYVMQELKELDPVAYVRFASVYKQFEDISTFYEFVEKLTGVRPDKN